MNHSETVDFVSNIFAGFWGGYQREIIREMKISGTFYNDNIKKLVEKQKEEEKIRDIEFWTHYSSPYNG